MRFHLIDSIIDQTDERIVALKQVSLAEEYLADHFPAFPVLPGVMMVEAMVQAARFMLTPRVHQMNGQKLRLVLGEVRAMKFGNMVRPGEQLEVEINLNKQEDDGSFACKGVGRVLRRAAGGSATRETAVSGRFTMRPVRLG